MIKVVQNDSKVPAGSYGEVLDRLGVEWQLLPVDQRVPFPGPVPGDRLILLGGYMSVAQVDRFPYLLAVKRGLKAWLAAECPVLGICLGGQLLAEVAGGTVTCNSRGERGMLPIELTAAGRADPLFAGLPSPFLSMQWHNDSFSVPPDAVHLAASAACPGQAFRVGRAAYGLQFHPELTAGIVAAWSQKLQLGDAPLVEFAERETLYAGYSHRILSNFLALP